MRQTELTGSERGKKRKKKKYYLCCYVAVQLNGNGNIKSGSVQMAATNYRSN